MTIAWVVFNVILVALILLDLNFAKGRKLRVKEALSFSLGWVILASLFALLIACTLGWQAALEFSTGYLIELSLSVDNLFVFLLAFQYFAIPEKLQPKILFWGVIGALVMRLVCILVGLSLIQTFSFVFYIFGAFLITVSLCMLLRKDKEIKPQNNYLLQIAKKFVPFLDHNVGDKFFVKQGGKIFATPLFAALITIETLDLVFALDSIPAIFGVTSDPFIVYTSNALAILGLRSLYFAIQHLTGYFAHLHYGVSCVLFFIGLKMVGKDVVEINAALSLAVIIFILTSSILSSLISKGKGKKHEPS